MSPAVWLAAALALRTRAVFIIRCHIKIARPQKGPGVVTWENPIVFISGGCMAPPPQFDP
eukprot:351291-Chlamydomonas_euryale.AAC.4